MNNEKAREIKNKALTAAREERNNVLAEVDNMIKLANDLKNQAEEKCFKAECKIHDEYGKNRKEGQ